MWHCSEFLFLLVLLFFQRWHWKVTENGAEAAVGTVSSCLPLPDIINYYWCKLWPHFPSITPSPPVLSQHIGFLLICTFITPHLCRLIRKEETVTETQKIHLLHIPQEWPSAHRTQLRQNSSSALMMPYHWEILSCCSSGSHTHRNTHTNWWLGFWELDYQMKKSGDVGKVLRFVKWTPRKTKHNILKCYYLICQLTNTNI